MLEVWHSVVILVDAGVAKVKFMVATGDHVDVLMLEDVKRVLCSDLGCVTRIPT